MTVNGTDSKKQENYRSAKIQFSFASIESHGFFLASIRQVESAALLFRATKGDLNADST
jgi:hypothetical protein